MASLNYGNNPNATNTVTQDAATAAASFIFSMENMFSGKPGRENVSVSREAVLV